ncbi:MAG: hypothetical protein EBY01_01315 [Actinobacteria bacterium]|nr:hypothetical protein [Actinomycetota bacterium]
MFKKTTTRILLGTVAAAALIGSALVPAQAATRDTIVLQENNFFGSFNTSKKTTNVVINSTVNSLMGMGFWYYNDEADIVRNTDFGTYRFAHQHIQRLPELAILRSLAILHLSQLATPEHMASWLPRTQ